MGRKTLLTKQAHTAVLEGIAAGLRYADAATLAGVHPRTLRAWRTRGDEALEPVGALIDSGDLNPAETATFADILDLIDPTERPYARLVFDLAEARTKGKAELLAKMRKHADSEWRAAAWILERRYPDEFGTRHTVDVDTRTAVSVKVDPDDVETLSAIAAALSEANIGTRTDNDDEAAGDE